MPTPTIPDGELFFNATLWNGNGGTQTITNGAPGQSFQPDFVWLKMRSGTDWHLLQDSVRGAGKCLNSNVTNVETGNAGDLISSFNANGFTVNNTYLGGANTTSNGNGSTFVGWNWKAGGAAVTNTAGSISSQVSANTTSGFSIVTYTGTGSNATVGHGLGVAPSMVIVRNRSIIQNFIIGHTSLWDSNLNSFLLFTDAATSTNSAIWNGIRPTSTTISIGTDSGTNGSGNSMLAYCWAPVDGYSAFGSYTGNGSTNGPFIYLGFRPRYVLLKRYDSGSAANWQINDSARDTFNVANKRLSPSTSDAEATNFNFGDFLSNGFKIRQTDQTWNASGGTYIYAAFAENPFKYANAR